MPTPRTASVAGSGVATALVAMFRSTLQALMIVQVDPNVMAYSSASEYGPVRFGVAVVIEVEPGLPVVKVNNWLAKVVPGKTLVTGLKTAFAALMNEVSVALTLVPDTETEPKFVFML